MKILQSIFTNIIHIKKWFLKVSIWEKIIITGIVFGIGWVVISGMKSSTSRKSSYQTAQVERGMLIISVTASGQVSAANSASVTTQTSGVVSRIFVENGQLVKSGDPIAQVDLDMDGKQRAAQALASYQNAKNSLESAHATLYSLHSALFTQWKTYMDIAQNSTYQNPDGSPNAAMRKLPQYISTDDDWLAAEAKYKNQQNVVAQAQTAVNSAWASYQLASPTIYAPITGTISGLSFQAGSVLTAQTGSSGNSAAQRIANIKTDAAQTVAINLTQIDVPKIKPGNLATLTLDALPGKTYTGKVISIDTTGSVSSGVTTYPAVIKLDTGTDEIFSNMSAQANIIIQMKDNVLLISSGAIQKQNEQSYVRMMRNGVIKQVPVEVGLASNTQTEIVSGLTDGDTIITSIMNTTVNGKQSSQTQSPFGAFGGRGFGAGGAIRIQGH